MTTPNSNGTKLIGVLAHELRNPLASLQGCAMTLLDREDDLTPETRAGLTRVIVGQSQRLDWLIRATAALGGASGRLGASDVDVASVVENASGFAGVTVSDADRLRPISGDPKRVQLAVESVMLALSSGGADCSAQGRGTDVLEVESTARDLDQGERQWKLDLARRLLREEGCGVTIRRTTAGARATIRFGSGRSSVRGTQ